jgi:hypothetical protein
MSVGVEKSDPTGRSRNIPSRGPGMAAFPRRHAIKETGRRGLPAKAVLRCALLKKHHS